MKQILQLFKDFGTDCDLDVNNHLMFYNEDNDITHIEHLGEMVIEEYLDGTMTSSNNKAYSLNGRDAVTILFGGDFSLALETIIENEKYR
jgi:hypothetical protein